MGLVAISKKEQDEKCASAKNYPAGAMLESI